MDIPGLSMRMAQSNLLTDVGTAMLAKTMEQADSVSDRKIPLEKVCDGALCQSRRWRQY